MYLLMDKQKNRGQDGAGLACGKIEVPPGVPFLSRERVSEPRPVWGTLVSRVEKLWQETLREYPSVATDPQLLAEVFPFAGELYLGHLRYGTHGLNRVENCHPVVRPNNWRTRTLALAGNFNLTNVNELFDRLVNELGQHPVFKTDTETVLERVGHFLDVENQRLFDQFKHQGLANPEISRRIAQELDLLRILERSASNWDGGYTLGGILGHGDAFVARDPNGIRPCYYSIQEDFIIVASERPAMATVFHLPTEAIQELPPAHALTIKADGSYALQPFAEPRKRQSCSFERIYFSRGTDFDIYKERKLLGRFMAERVERAIDGDLNNTVFGFIPNTSLVAFMGLIKELDARLSRQKAERIKNGLASLTTDQIQEIITERVRIENVIIKDTKSRTFISDETNRKHMAEHVYDITYGSIREGQDNLVCIDDSIVRGNTLQQSILKMLARLKPKKLIIVSSAPQIRYPDCYGIDMSRLDEFIAFRAAISLLHTRGLGHIIQEVYTGCLELQRQRALTSCNLVQRIYEPFADEDISEEIARLIYIPELNCPLQVVYQSVEGLHKALNGDFGDWYFTGNYPTPGGNQVCNQAFIHFVEGKKKRAY
jgi:amidophosphoribosyltransferase